MFGERVKLTVTFVFYLIEFMKNIKKKLAMNLSSYEGSLGATVTVNYFHMFVSGCNNNKLFLYYLLVIALV